ALFWKMPIDQWGHARAPHVMLDLTDEADADAMINRVDEVLPSSLDVAAAAEPRQ
ncbi:MAG: hypothetical protein JNM69_32095, partial [Archangium sp.]|nr:hypothetical protein [Archangium sp.]